MGLALSVAPALVVRWVTPPVSAAMIGAWFSAQRAARDDYRLRHAPLPLEAVAPVLQLAIVAAEDQRFPLHHGFDLTQIEAALRGGRAGRPLRGASTLTQQVAKNLFLWSGRSWVRKGLEAWFTLWLELLCPKRRILELYLNFAQFGDGIFGVGAASREYFGKPPVAVTPNEAALLAAVLPNPVRLQVARPSPYVRARQRWIRQQMEQLGGPGYLAGLTR